jgi:transcription initiation factor TFIIIB Brf1 subunit/transcription initiation factor TFIIB
MHQPKISEEQKKLIHEHFDRGYKPKEVSEMLCIPYNQVVYQRKVWLARQKGFKSYAEYQEHLARQKGFKSRAEYQEHLARQKGFKSYAEYREHLARQKGFKSYAEYREHLARQKGFKSRAEYLEHLARQKGFKSRAEYLEHLARQKGFKSYAEYQEHLARQKGFKSYAEYQRHAKLVAMLKDVSVGEKYGEDILEKILEEYKFLDVEVGLRGREMSTTLAAVTYGVLRKEGEPITLDDVSELFGRDRKNIARVYRDLYGVVGGIPVQDTKSYIRRGIIDLNLREEVERGAIEFYENNRDILRRFGPSSSAAVCIFVQSKKYGEKKAQKEIGESLKVTPATIRNIVRILKESGRL